MAQEPVQRDIEFHKPAKFELAVLALIVLACSQLGYVGHPRYGPFIATADVFCGVLFLAWLAKVHREKRWGKLLWPPVAVWAWIAAGTLSISMTALDAEGSLSLGGIKDGAVEVAQIVLYFVVAYMIFADVLNSVAKMRRACSVLLGATTVVVVWGVVDYLLQTDPMNVKAGFGNRNVYSAFLVMALPLLFGVAIHERDAQQRGWVMALVGGAMLTMLGPPHVWLLLAILCWMAYMRRGRIRSYFIPLAIGIAVAVSSALPRNTAANVNELVDPHERGELYKLDLPAQEDETGVAGAGEEVLIVKKRWLEWQPALAMMTEDLPLGVGAGSFQRRIGEARYYGSLPNVKKGEPDTNNFYLVVGASMGFAGLVCVVAMLAWFWRRAATLWLRAGSGIERGLAAGLAGALVGIMAANLFTSLFVRGVSIIWALVFAMITVATREGIAAMRREEADRAR